jgi:hypothetical protein
MKIDFVKRSLERAVSLCCNLHVVRRIMIGEERERIK